MPRIQKIYIAGATIEIENTYSSRYGKKIARGKNHSPTPESVARYNEKLAEDNLRRTLNENFTYRDYHLVLTYRKEERPKPDEAQKRLTKFLRRLRAEYRKRNAELRYIAVTEYEGKAIHHHLVVNRLDESLFSDLWEYGRPHMTPLDASGDYSGLAHYLIKETNQTYRNKDGVWRKRWNGSKNLRKVEPIITVLRSNTWRKKPNVPRKWRDTYFLLTDSVREGVSGVTGFPYQSYRLIRINGVREGLPTSISPPAFRAGGKSSKVKGQHYEKSVDAGTG